MKRSIILLSGLWMLASCSKEIRLSNGTPDFNVGTDAATYQAGQEVEFKFTGSADLISFYSGEVYHQYDFRDGRVVEGGPLTLSFTSAVTGGTQPNQLSVVVSTDFNGNFNDFASVQSATWTDITSRFVLGTNATFRASTEQDISDLIEEGKPLYLAYKYVTQPQGTAGVARSWMVQALALKSNTSIGSITLASMATASFKIVNQLGTGARSSLTATRLTLLGNTFDATNDPYHEIWGMVKAVTPDKIDLGPDRPVPIKGIADASLSSYSYVFDTPGTYKVTFVASNTNIDKTETVVRQLDITITP